MAMALMITWLLTVITHITMPPPTAYLLPQLADGPRSGSRWPVNPPGSSSACDMNVDNEKSHCHPHPDNPPSTPHPPTHPPSLRTGWTVQ